MRIAELYDAKFIFELLKDRGGFEEGVPLTSDWVLASLMTPGIVNMVSDNAYFQFLPMTLTNYLMHPCVARGADSAAETAAAIALLKKVSDAHTVCGLVPDYSPHVARFFERNGFENTGVMKSSIRKDGEFYDQHIYGKEV